VTPILGPKIVAEARDALRAVNRRRRFNLLP